LEGGGFSRQQNIFVFSRHEIWQFISNRQKEICAKSDSNNYTEIEDSISVTNVGSKKAKTGKQSLNLFTFTNIPNISAVTQFVA
jgi:hypothetical protein